MSISGSSDDGSLTTEELEEYNDGVAVATMSQRINTSTANWSANENNDGITGSADIGTLLGIDRNEVAELVAIERPVFRVWHTIRGGGSNTAQTAYLDMQFYANGFPNFTNYAHPDALDPDDDGTDELSSATFVEATGGEVDDEGALLWKDETNMEPVFENGTDGTGGPGATYGDMSHPIRDYRGMFGRGPLFYEEDELGGSWYLRLAEWGDGDFDAFQQVKMYFDIFEAEESEYSDVQFR